MNYFTHDGFICAENFSDNDAKVVCKDKGFSFGYGIKASALGKETDPYCLSCLMRKPVLGVSNQVQHKLSCSTTEDLFCTYQNVGKKLYDR